MRITFVLPTVNMSGGIRVISIYAKALRDMGHEVVLVSPPPQTLSLKYKIKSLIKYKQWPSKKTMASHLNGLNLDHRILESWRPVNDNDLPDADIIIATWWETAIWVNELSEKKGKKVYFMQDYGEVPGQPLKNIQDTWMLPFYIITISQWLMALIVAYKGDEKHLTLVQNGIELDSFYTKKRDKNIIPTVGFLYTEAPQKGANLMFSAYIKAKQKIPDLRLMIFGGEPLPEHMKHHADVTYLQNASDEEIVKVYSSCDAWLFGSTREGFGLPILEAMACRTPVIATNAGAALDLVGPEVGALLKTYHADEMASQIVEIVSKNNASWEKLSEGAYAEAKKHSWSIATKEFDETLKRICS